MCSCSQWSPSNRRSCSATPPDLDDHQRRCKSEEGQALCRSKVLTVFANSSDNLRMKEDTLCPGDRGPSSTHITVYVCDRSGRAPPPLFVLATRIPRVRKAVHPVLAAKVALSCLGPSPMPNSFTLLLIFSITPLGRGAECRFFSA